jgi:hypothetical protein
VPVVHPLLATGVPAPMTARAATLPVLAAPTLSGETLAYVPNIGDALPCRVGAFSNDATGYLEMRVDTMPRSAGAPAISAGHGSIAVL